MAAKVDFFERVWEVESCGDVAKKFALFERLWADFHSGEFAGFGAGNCADFSVDGAKNSHENCVNFGANGTKNCADFGADTTPSLRARLAARGNPQTTQTTNEHFGSNGANSNLNGNHGANSNLSKSAGENKLPRAANHARNDSENGTTNLNLDENCAENGAKISRENHAKFEFDNSNGANSNLNKDKTPAATPTTHPAKLPATTRRAPAHALCAPSYAAACKVVEIRDFSQKTSLIATHKAAGKSPATLRLAALLHAVAHIEFSAIDLALDAAHRFDGLPREYYADWLGVARDEVRHFGMLAALLAKTGFAYGDFAVHNGLFCALEKTAHSLAERMALVPRYMEANGLESNAQMQAKLRGAGGAGGAGGANSNLDGGAAQNDGAAGGGAGGGAGVTSVELLAALDVIFNEEIHHVSCGSKWFKFACERDGIDVGAWFEIVKKHFPNAFKNQRTLCEVERLQAGFTPAEIARFKSHAE